jgi:Na+-transporting methylmalonyl-CoA/oxaloacetate decarboxylase gamma subunit
MNDLLANVIAGSDFQKGVFLMVTGIVFVFAVQTLFYFFIKAFVGKNKE